MKYIFEFCRYNIRLECVQCDSEPVGDSDEVVTLLVSSSDRPSVPTVESLVALDCDEVVKETLVDETAPQNRNFLSDLLEVLSETLDFSVNSAIELPNK